MYVAESQKYPSKNNNKLSDIILSVPKDGHPVLI